MTAKKKPTSASVPVDALKHPADTRPNIPTRETAAFAADDGPPPFVVHRDRSLDPQLVWKGKDEQDAAAAPRSTRGEWSKLYSATSQPFDAPKSGKIAVKVINHFGDEVLKVYDVRGRLGR